MANEYTKKTSKKTVKARLKKTLQTIQDRKVAAEELKQESPELFENGAAENAKCAEPPSILQSSPVRPESLRDRINMEVSGALGFLAYAKRELKRAEETLTEAERRLFDVRKKQTIAFELESDF